MTWREETLAEGVRLICGDCREVLPTLGKVDAVVTDPPYGIGADAAAAKNKGKWGWKFYGDSDWDKQRPPAWVLMLLRDMSQNQIVWGGNYFTDILPPTMQWLVWDKGQRDFSLADFEMAWSSKQGAARIIDVARAVALLDGKEHPTQKPIEVMRWCIEQLPPPCPKYPRPLHGLRHHRRSRRQARPQVHRHRDRTPLFRHRLSSHSGRTRRPRLVHRAAQACKAGGIHLNFLNWIWPKPALPAATTIRAGVLPITLDGSLQNPAWSPDGSKIVFTRFRNGYNDGPADVMILNLSTMEVHAIASDGSDNVSQPGSTWNKATGEICFSSDRGGHDEVWAIKDGAARKVTSRPGLVAYEPSWSPDGRSTVFESHHVDEEGHGRIAIRDPDGAYRFLTSYGIDCRQPNWSPCGDLIVYQMSTGRHWELMLYDTSLKEHRVITGGLPCDKTDATFSPDGQRILYSGTSASGSDGLMTIAIDGSRPSSVDHGSGYWGAASWSPDGKWIAAETSPSDPDGGPGTKLAIVRAP